MNNFKSTNVFVKFMSWPGGLVVLILILGGISGVLQVLKNHSETEKILQSKMMISEISAAIIEYKQVCNRLPDSLQELEVTPNLKCPNWKLTRNIILKDAWGNPFTYEKKEATFEIVLSDYTAINEK